jgi:hypothetical protein
MVKPATEFTCAGFFYGEFFTRGKVLKTEEIGAGAISRSPVGTTVADTA